MGYFQARQEYAGDNLRSTAYDRVASLLVAVLTLVGTIFLLLLGMWVAPQKQDEVVIVYQPELVERSDEEEIFEFETPSASELPGVPLIQTPALFAASVAETMTSLSTIEVAEETADQPNERQAGPSPGPDGDKIPRWQRWEILYAVSSVDAYARQLDHFEIELGAAGGGRKNVDYAAGFTAASPQVREAPGTEDERLYMTWRDGPLKKFDRTLLERAGIAVERRILLQFYSAKLEAVLADLEHEHAGDRPVQQIRKTVFSTRAAGDGYEFFIKDQQYR